MTSFPYSGADLKEAPGTREWESAEPSFHGVLCVAIGRIGAVAERIDAAADLLRTHRGPNVVELPAQAAR